MTVASGDLAYVLQNEGVDEHGVFLVFFIQRVRISAGKLGRYIHVYRTLHVAIGCAEEIPNDSPSLFCIVVLYIGLWKTPNAFRQGKRKQEKNRERLSTLHAKP